MNCSLFSERRMQSFDHVMPESDPVVTCSVFLKKSYYKSATFLLPPFFFLLSPCLLSFLYLIFSPSPPLCWWCHLESKLRDLICLTTQSQQKRRWRIIPATWFALLCRGLGGSVGTRVILRGNDRRQGKNGGGVKEMPLTAENQI